MNLSLALILTTLLTGCVVVPGGEEYPGWRGWHQGPAWHNYWHGGRHR